MRYALLLNPMRSGNIENLTTVAMMDTREELVAFYRSELAEAPWMDGRWSKTFKAGSPLEWFNGADDLDSDSPYWGGIYPVDDDMPAFTLTKW